MIEGNGATGNVFINEVKLDPAASQAIINHSPDGFAWGYGGSGPAQLSLALLLALTTKKFAQAHYYELLADKIAPLEVGESFKMNTATIRAWARDHGWRGETE